MKNVLYQSLILLIFISCQTDQNVDPIPGPSPVQDAFLTTTKNYVPLDTLKDGAKVVFVNEAGDERALTLKVEQGFRTQYLNGDPYESEYYNIFYIDTISSIFYRPTIRLQSEYSDLTHKNEVAIISLFNYLLYSPKVIIEADGNVFFGNMEGPKEIAGRTFQNVYANFIDPQLDQDYSIIYYTIKEGVVGFEGENNVMWALDRIEK
jgi:hypothetical protein